MSNDREIFPENVQPLLTSIKVAADRGVGIELSRYQVKALEAALAILWEKAFPDGVNIQGGQVK